jgi:hypothetical protein
VLGPEHQFQSHYHARKRKSDRGNSDMGLADKEDNGETHLLQSHGDVGELFSDLVLQLHCKARVKRGSNYR